MIKQEPQGIILIISLILMAVLLSIALGFSVFIISDLRQAKQIDNAVSAYYSADAGLERSLFLLRHSYEIETVGALVGIVDGNKALENGAEFNISQSVDYEENFLRQRLFNGEAVKVYFLNRDSDVKAIGVTWSWNDPTIKLKMAFTQLDPQSVDGSIVYYTDLNYVDDLPETGKNCFEFTGALAPEGNFIDIELLPERVDYVVEFQALGNHQTENYVDNLRVIAYSDENCDSGSVNEQAISNITLKADGYYGGAYQQIVAHMPPRDPVSGLLGFVLFSEQDIIKGY